MPTRIWHCDLFSPLVNLSLSNISQDEPEFKARELSRVIYG